MTEEQFIELVKRSEKAAAENINSYKFRLALFALLGYLVVFGVLALLVVLAGGTVAIAFASTSLFILIVKKKIIIAILAAIWLFLKALWVKFDAPTGYVLDREQYPLLFEEIDQLTKTLDALKIHQVILDERLNAAVVQTPRFGLFGGQTNTLFLGLQLLMALSPQGMRAVLAHEFGHLSGNHSRFSAWIYRIRVTWQRIMSEFDTQESYGAMMMRVFFDWYAPKFSAYSFALARSNEYEADQISSELTSPDTAAQALVSVYAAAPYIDDVYWQEYFQAADVSPQPPGKPYEGLAKFLKSSPIENEVLKAKIAEEMKVETHYADTHPSLKDRVVAIRPDNSFPDLVERHAAEEWLGDRYQAVVEYFDREWYENNREAWSNRYEYTTQAKKHIEHCKGQAIGSLNNDDLWKYAVWTCEFSGDDIALPLFRAYQEKDPDSVGAAYYIGRALVIKQDEEALVHLKIALNNANTIEEAAQWGYDLLKQKGKDEEAEQWWEEVLKANDRLKLIQQEREDISEENEFEKSGIDEAYIEHVKERLAGFKKIRHVWIARKVLKYDSDLPVLVIAFKEKGLCFDPKSLEEKVLQLLDLGTMVFVICVSGEYKDIGKKIKEAGLRIM